MYSPAIIEANISKVVDAERVRRNDPKFRIIRFDPPEIDDMVAHLDKLVDKRTIKEDGSFEWSRELTAVEQRFIDNEMILCQLDWRHWAENFCLIQLHSLSDRPEGWDILEDGHTGDNKGPLGKFILNGMQEALLLKMARLEDIAHDQAKRKVPVNGILLILLKARHLGASTAWQSFIRHRVNFYSYFPALIASIDAQSTQSLQRRSERMWEKMPIWMRAKIKRKTIDGGSEFVNDSMIQLQDFRQQKDLGKGETWVGFHGTEISVVAPDRAYDHFDEGLFPAVPFDRRTLFGMESTAKGKSGYWYEFCTNVMSGTAEGGAGRFDYNFAPFYLIDAYQAARGQRSKCRMEVPIGWEPRPDTVLAAERVYDTSHLYMPDHSKVRLDKEVMYWYEVTRQQAFRKGKLNIFKQSYPIEPIDAFQHSAAGAFTNETIDRMQLNSTAYVPIPYRLMTEDELPEVEQYADAKRSPIHHVVGYHLGPMHEGELDDALKDPRGIVWVFEQPDTRATYVQACDPPGSGGIPKWTRQARTHNDIKIDNGAVQVWRKEQPRGQCDPCHGLGWLPTEQKGVQLECSACDGRGRVGGRAVQVVDFAAPMDAEEIAVIPFILGRIYRGASDLDECELIINRISVGMLTVRTLQNRGYTNLWQTEAVQDGIAIKTLPQIGFNEHPSTVPILHSRGRLLLVRRDMEPRSKFLIKELGDAVVKTVGVQTETSAALKTYERFYVPPNAGQHDDRMITAFLAGWVLFPVRDGDDLAETPAEGLLRELPGRMGAMFNKELAGQGVTAEAQHAVWNEVVGRMYEDQDLQFGHFEDCSPECQATHASAEEIELDSINPYARLGGDDDPADEGLF